jgi:hypothetical protein
MSPRPTEAPAKPAIRPAIWIGVSAVALFLLGIGLRRSFSHGQDTHLVEASPQLEKPAIPSASPTPTPPTTQTPASSMEEAGGIRVHQVRLALQGAAIEVLYTIVDLDKARSLATNELSTHLLESGSGRRLELAAKALPKGINAHTRARAAMLTNPQGQGFPPSPYRLVAGKTYSILIPNPQATATQDSLWQLVCGPLQSAPLPVLGEENPRP